MDFIGSITSIKSVDLLMFFVFFALFILGYMQGFLRRLIGIAAILVSLLVAAQVRAPLGDFLAVHWTQFSTQYNHMIAFGAVFVAGVVASTISIQLFFKPMVLFTNYPALDEMLGGVLGLVQGALIVAAFYIITDPFFSISGIAQQANEFPFIRPIHDAFQGSVTAGLARDRFAPFLLLLLGGVFPSDVRSVFS